MADEPITPDLTPDEALRRFKAACNTGPDVLFITERWFAPFEARLRACLPTPIGDAAAAALEDALRQRERLQTVVRRLEELHAGASGDGVGEPDYDALSERFLEQSTPPPPGVEESAVAGYVRYKAFVYLAIGPDAYRKGDYFNLPPESWSADLLDAIRRGCQQLLDWRGFAPDRPLEGLGIGPFYRLLELFHFERVSQELLDGGGPGQILDRMRMRHVVKGEEIVLYNLVKSPIARLTARCPQCRARLLEAEAEKCPECGAGLQQ